MSLLLFLHLYVELFDPPGVTGAIVAIAGPFS
jgi:hypothetical protein